MSDHFDLKHFDPQKAVGKRRRRTEAYRRVFATPAGRIVLTDMLNDLGAISGRIESEEDRVLNNYARTLLKKIGIWKGRNIYHLTDALLKDVPWNTDDHFKEE
jgi:hypothetical protein